MILLLNCQKEDNIHVETQSEKFVHRLSLEDFNSKVVKNESYNKLQNHFDTNIKGSIAQSRTDRDNDMILLTDEILLIQKNDIDYYTFKIDTETYNDEFYNLVLYVSNNEIINSKIFEYQPDDIWLEDTLQPYQGYVALSNNDNISTDNLFGLRTNECVVDVITEWNCNANNNHAPDTCLAGGSDLIVTLIYGSCTGGDDGGYTYVSGDEEATDDNTSSSGGNTNDSNTTNDNSTPIIPLAPIPLKTQIIDCINGDTLYFDITTVDPEIFSYLSLTRIELNTMNNYLQDNNCSEEAQGVVVQQLEDAYFENYIGSLSEEELSEYVWYDDIQDIPAQIDRMMNCFENIRSSLSDSSTFSITIYVEQPIPNSDAPNDGTNPGHTFISMSTNDPTNSDNSITQTFGFYPAESVYPHLGINTSDGEFINNANHFYHVSATININETQFFGVVSDVTNMSSPVPEYNLETNNCTDTGISIANSVGMNLPDTNGTWGIDVPLIGFKELGSGSNPGALGQDIRNLINPNVTVNITDGANGPSSQGECD